ncbi:MAG: rod shape-determining protein MreD [Paracoccaceae bacterium]
MARTAPSQLLAMRAVYIGLCLLVMIAHLLPLDTVPRFWAPPDILMAFTFAWALRRPDYVPILSIAAVFLTADLLFQRPPGLLAALMVVGTEALRIRFAGLREASFVGEWVSVCVMVAGIVVINRLVLIVVASDPPALGLTLIQMVLTMLIYPLAVVATTAIMRVRKPDPRKADGGLGARS